jgi:GNAT superfamily N-acetyltransferase
VIPGLHLRPARVDEVPALNELIQDSARALSRGFYSPVEIEAAVRHVFGVDTSLIEDGTYYVVESEGELAGCGGWSTRRTLYGGDQRRVGPPERLDPAQDAARIRAFFVAPRCARRGLARALLATCEEAAQRAGFRALELMATLPGVPFYSACGFHPLAERRDVVPGGVELRFVHMRKELP